MPVQRFQVFVSSTIGAAREKAFGFCPQCGQPLSPPDRREQPVRRAPGAADAVPAVKPSPVAPQARQRCSNCGFTAYLNPSPGITIIITDDKGKVLIGKRSRKTDYGGKWCLPGGYVEYEESFIDTAHREVEEETGLSVEIEGIVNVVSNLLDNRHHTLVVVLTGTPVAGSLRPGDDVTELRWIDRDEHRQIEYAFEADRRIIGRYFEGNVETIPLDPRFRRT